MRVQDIIDKINDDTKIDDVLIDLAELAETENYNESRIAELEGEVESRDKVIRDLKIDNHELLKKVVNSVDFHKDDETEDDDIEIKSTEEIYKGFMER